MKTVLLGTTSLWNCGDDFIREGVLELLQLKSGVRTLWWNRGYGIKNAYANDLDTNLPLIDYFIAASTCLLYTSPSPRDRTRSRMPSSA